MRQFSPWKCWLLGWLLFISSSALSQEAFFNIRHLSVEEGMSARFVTNIIQDKQGFIWLGTDYGVNRYDGRHFKTYDAAQYKMRVNSRADLYLDVNGNIWVNNEQRQVDIFNPLTETVTPIESLVPQFGGKFVKIRGIDGKGVIWGTVDEDVIFTYDGRFHVAAANPLHRWEKKAAYMFPSPWGTLFSARGKALLEFDSSGLLLNNYPMEQTEFGSANPTDSSVLLVKYRHLPGKEGFNALFYEVKKNEPPKPITLNYHGLPFYFTDLESNYATIGANRDTYGHLWVSFNKYLLVFDQCGEIIAEVPEAKEYWRHFQASSIFFDTQGQAWVRAKEGVFVVSLRQPNMRKLLQASEVGISVRGIVPLYDDGLLACTYDGLYFINIKPGVHEKLIDKVYFGATCVGDSVIWFGSHSNKVVRFDVRRHSFENIKVSEKLSQSDEFLRPFEDPFTGQIYIGTRRQGLVIFDEATQGIVPFTKFNHYPEFSKLEVLHLLPTPECIWLCTSNGLYQMDRQRGVLARFNSFPSNFIYHLSIDKDGVFWMATRGGGLLKWFKNSGLVKQYTTADGLSHNIIYAVYDDSIGHLWMPSNYGLMSFEKSTGMTVNYLPEEGTTDEEFNSSAHFKGKDGTFYFGGLNGITAFNPKDVVSKRISQPLVITGLKVLKDNALENRLEQFFENRQIVVEPDERFFTLEFALLDYQAKKLVYAWNLEGLDKNWTVQTENNIRFNALPYGKFTLRIKAQGAGNAWSENELKIPIIVVRPFIKTWKFLILCISAISLIVFLSVRWRIQWLRQEKRRLAQVVEERTKELLEKNVKLESTNHIKDRLFRIIAHDLRSPLVTLGGLARKVAFLMRQERMDEVQELGETVENSVASVRNLLDNLLKWSIVEDGNFPNNPELIHTAEVADEVIDLYRAIAETKGIQLCLMNVNDPIIFADRNALSTIVRNLVDNAIKFTSNGGTVEVRLERFATSAIVQVTDSGIGIPDDVLPSIFELKGSRGAIGTKGEKGNGLGLVLCKELVEINQGTIMVSQNEGSGTTFTVRLPISGPISVG
ncbi:MAG: hypothetical protein IT258_13975 [Saprospiraceae bacterium]|nr:hypothetical protein [Saprospiraceae bacterium]